MNSTSTSVALSADVGSSMMRMREFDRKRARDLDDLLLTQPQILDQGHRVDVLLEIVHQRARLALLLGEVDCRSVMQSRGP